MTLSSMDMQFTRGIECIAQTDVIVVGSGSAGSSAAIAAARENASVLLLERYPFLGGTSTAVLDTFYGFYTPGSQSRKVVGGVADDVVAELRRIDKIVERPNTYGAGQGITYHPEYLKCAWERLVQDAGARILLNCWVQDVVVHQNRITGLVVATRQGLARVEARTFIDASGDADLCYWSDAPFELAGEHQDAQSLTTTFRMCNVDVDSRRTIDKVAFHRLMGEAANRGYSLPRREGSDHITTIHGVLATNLTRVKSFERRNGTVVNATDPTFLSAAEVAGREQALEYIRFLRDCVPGYRNADLASFSTQTGIRETRRVIGDCVLTRDDVLSARQFEDQIGLCGAPIEEHGPGDVTRWEYLPDGECVGIPYRTLLPQNLENVLVAGRCFSASHDAHASVRSMAQCMAMGQAAGIAAAYCVHHHTDTRSIPYRALRERLLASQAILELNQQAHT
ncbi:MAG TPA: FAD-dependent oxidoreductase [Edaphobacter sp.]|nr:FAD-dependent oxidoreductase [Edaphobacter sp.]